MKRLIAFVGSARKYGVTYRATRQFLDNLQSLGDIQSDLLFLSDHNVGAYRGCKACMIRGEESCPLHDDREAPFRTPTIFQLVGFRMARTSIRPEQPPARPDPTYYRDRGWFDSDYDYPMKLGPPKRAAGAAFDRIAARSSKAREYRPARS